MENNFSLNIRDTNSKDRSCPGLNQTALSKSILFNWWSPSKKTTLAFYVIKPLFPPWISIAPLFYGRWVTATAYIPLTYQGFTSLYFLLFFPYGNCQDWFLLWNVLHMQILELARLGTSPLSTTRGKKKKLPAMMTQKTFMLLLILPFHVQVMLIIDFSFLITVLDELYDFLSW